MGFQCEWAFNVLQAVPLVGIHQADMWGLPGLGIELARPQFRSKMEEDMKDIANGRKQKDDVVSEWMRIMMPVLKTCMEKTQQLQSEMQRFFQVCCLVPAVGHMVFCVT